MPQMVLTIDLADLASARAIAERIELSPAGEPHAVTLFERTGGRAWRVEAYYEDAPDMALVEDGLGDDIARLSTELSEVPDENWVAMSQAALPPVEAGRFVVHGSHDRERVGRRHGAILIDAGEAFGTAHHATTHGCLLALDHVTRQRAFGRVLDLGCGSGVLSIAASRVLPAARITASDIDRTATEVARANARVNGASGRIAVFEAAGLAHPAIRRRSPYDMLLANILAGPLIRLAPAVSRAVRPGGIAVLSGILSNQSPEVEAAYRASGFRLERKRHANGWATLVLKRVGRRQITTSRRAA